MDLTYVIIGEVTTEKSERLKQTSRVHTLHVHDQATKVDVQNALKTFYDISAESVRIIKVGPKTRAFGNNKTMQKRARTKKALVTLPKKSKTLDLTTFKA